MLLKKIDKAVGAGLASLLPGPGKDRPIETRRFLVIRPGGIGDAVLLIPSLLALKENFPDAEVTVLAEARNAAAFSLCRAVDRLLLYDKPADLVQAVRQSYDVVIDTEQWHRLSAVVARVSRAPLSIGFATNGRKRLFSEEIAYSHDDYERDSFLNLLAPLGISADAAPDAPFLSIPEEAARRAAEVMPPSDGEFFVAIFPGASIAERRWGAERFRRMADHLMLRGIPVVVVGGEGDAEEGAYIVRNCRGLNLAGKTTLAETAAVIARSALLVSGDSGVLHVAVGLGIPTVSLFGPGIEAKWGPKGEDHLVLNKKLPCSPCTSFGTTPPCKEKARCLTEIGIDEVVSAVMQLLSRRAEEG